jgi:hypothetical protein
MITDRWVNTIMIHVISRIKRRDWIVVGLGIMVTAATLFSGSLAAIGILLLLATPVLGFILGGRVSGRGAIVACIVLALGGTIIRSEASTTAATLGQMLLLTGMAAAALLAGSFAETMAPAQVEAAPAGRRWVTVVIETETPPDASGKPVRPTVAPRSDPERRSLLRRAGGRIKRYRQIESTQPDMTNVDA